METLILNRNNIFNILPKILLKLKQSYEIKISFKTEEAIKFLRQQKN